MHILPRLVTLAVLAATVLTTRAVTIDFGTTLEASDTLNSTSYQAGNVGNTEAQIASLINFFTGTTSFAAADILKVDPPIPESGDQFAVMGGYDYLLVKYDGPNGGSALFWLGGNDALVPYNSYPLWGDKAGKFAVSHYSLAGPVRRVPDGGTTAVLLALGMAGLGLVARRKRVR